MFLNSILKNSTKYYLLLLLLVNNSVFSQPSLSIPLVSDNNTQEIDSKLQKTLANPDDKTITDFSLNNMQPTGVVVPAFSATFVPDIIGPGANSKLIYTITNGESNYVTGLSFNNNLPAGVLLSDPANPITSCDMSNGGIFFADDNGTTITLTDAQIPASSSCTVEVNVTSNVAGTYMNVTGDLTSSAGNSGTASDDLTISTSRPGFSKSFSSPAVSLGTPVTLTFTIDNTANSSFIANISFTDNLPVGLIIASPANANQNCNAANFNAVSGTSSISMLGGFLLAGQTCVVTVDVIPENVGTFNNETTILSASGSGSLNSGFAVAKITSTADPVVFRKDFIDDPTPPGGTATLRFSITNTNRFDSADNISFDDDLDATLSALTAVNLPQNDVCGPGSTLTGSGFITLNGGNLPAEGVCVFDVDVQIPGGTANGQYINTTSSITGDINATPFSYSPAVAKLFVQPAPILTKEFTDDPVGSGSDVTLSFTIENGSSDYSATNINFIDELTTFLPFPVVISSPSIPTSGICGAGSNLSLISLGTGRQALYLTNGNLPAGGNCSFQVSLTIPSDMPNGIFTNTTEPIFGTVASEDYQGLPATDTLTVVAAPYFSKEFTDDPVASGDIATVEFTISHPIEAQGDATNLSFSDDLSTVLPGLTAIGLPQNDICGVGSSISGTTNLMFSGGTLSPGETCTISVTLQVPAAASSGSYTNTVNNFSATVLGINTQGQIAQDDLQIANISFTKEFLTNPVVPGQTTTLRFTIDNTQNTDAANITTFTDSLSTMLAGTQVAGPPITNTCGGTASGTTFLEYTGGSVPASSSCDIEVPVLIPVAAADGSYQNISSSLSTDIGTALPATDVLVVSSELIQLTKEFIDDPVAPGGTVALRFTLENLDITNPITSITFTDDLNAALSGLQATGLPVSVCGGIASANPNPGTIEFAGGSLPAGGSCFFDITLEVPASPGVSQAINTTSSVSGLSNGLPVSGSPASDTLYIQEIEFTKSFDGPSTATGMPVLTYTITNLSPSQSVSSLSFTDDMDAVISGLVATGLPMSNVCGAGSQISGTSLLTFSGGNLAPGASCNFNVQLQVPFSAMPGSYISTSSDLFVNGLTFANPAVDMLVIEPPPIFTKMFSPASIGTNQQSTLTFVIDNTASSLAANQIGFTDSFPAGVVLATNPNVNNTCGGIVTATGGTGVVSLTGASLAASASCSIQVGVVGTVAGMHVNVTGDLISSSGNSGSANAALTVNDPPSFSKTFVPDTIIINNVTTLTFTIDNSTSTVDATSLNFTDDLPSGILVATPANVVNTCTGGTITATSGTSVIQYNGGTVSLGSTCTISVDVIANNSGDLVNTSGNLTSNLGTSGSATDTLTVSPVPIFSKEFIPDSVLINQASQLVFTIDNSGSAFDATSLDFTDNLPANLFVANPANASTSCTGGTITATSGTSVISYTGGTASSGASCTVSVNVVSALTSSYVNLTGDLTSNHGNSGQATDTLNVFDIPSFQKAFNPDIVLVGEVSTLTFTIDNTVNTIDASNVSFTDNLPAGLVVANPANIQNTCTGGTVTATSGTSVISYASGTVPASSTCTISVDVVGNTSGNFVNVTGDLTSDLGNSGTATDSIIIAALPDFSKTFTGPPLIAGNVVQLVFELVNNTAATIDGISFSDDLDAFVPGAIATNLPMADVCGTGSSVSGSSVVSLQNGSLSANTSCQFTVMVFIPVDTTEGTYVNTTSALSVMVSGNPVDGGPASAASDNLYVNPFIPPIPVLSYWWLLVLLIAGFVVISTRFIKTAN
ncbi:MAG TPA: hypothetical protein PLX38_02030 [Gammaproteobacteria bacterium]|nr:hypothetical protein [Gammaproteobacteria bacterium]